MSIADALLDKSIVFSFDRTGFLRHQRQFSPSALDGDLAERRYLVTGANSGIGLAAARGLYRRGAEVVMLCRSEARGRAARDLLLAEHGAPNSARLTVVPLDVTVPDQIDRVADRFHGHTIDGLVHNAGMLADRLERTAEGWERTVATHVVGPLRLTTRLWPSLRRSADGRVVFVASGGLYSERLDPARLFEIDSGHFDGVRRYAQAKRAQLVLTQRLDELWRGTTVSAHVMHPGWVDTTAVRQSLPKFYRVMKRLLRTPEQGADTILWLLAAEEPGRQSGQFWFDRSVAAEHLRSGTRESPEARIDLWERLCSSLPKDLAAEPFPRAPNEPS